MKDIVKIMPMGGQDELGKNMYLITINNHMFIVDCGYRFPESDKLGVDVVIPSFDYLVDCEEEIEAIFITHGHDDSMAALPYLLEYINVPIYTSNLTADLIEDMFAHHNKRARTKLKPNIHRIHRKSICEIAGIEIKVFPLTHSIPGTIGLAFKTNEGYVVHAGEFIIDFGAPSYFKTDIQSLMEIGKEGVLALLCESGYAKRPGYTSPAHKISDFLKPIFEESTGRIIIASLSQNIFRTKEIIDLTRKYKRKLVLYTQDANDCTKVLLHSNRKGAKPVIEIENSMMITPQDMQYVKDEDLVILLTGSSTNIFHDINNIIVGGDDYLEIKTDDSFILACPTVPGTEKISAKVIDELYKTDANIYTLKSTNICSMHASVEDIKVMLQVLTPKYYFPIRGEYQHIDANQDIAIDMGIPPQNIIYMDNGYGIIIEDGKVDPKPKYVEIRDVMIDGIGVGDVEDKVINDRILLSNDGVVIIGMTINRSREIVAYTDVQTRGFVYLKDSEHIVKGIIQIAEEVIEANHNSYALDCTELRNVIKDKVNRFIMKTTGKKPVVLPVIIELD